MIAAANWIRGLFSREGGPEAGVLTAPLVKGADQILPEPLRLSDVFGRSSRSNPLSYIVRSVERDFREALGDEKYEVLVIYGTSKQGKSSLRRNVLPNGSCTFVSAGQNMSREALYRDALSEVGANIKTTHEHASTTETKFSIDVSGPPWLLLDKLLGGAASRKRERTEGGKSEEVEVDLSLAASVARLYSKYGGRKPIVIDNFHHIEPPVQAEIATDIRAFAEYGIKLVILGTWKAQNYIQKKNTDLIGRVCALSIEPWTEADLLRVIEAGEQLLNIRFEPNVRAILLQRCTGNIALLQEILNLYLRSLGIVGRCETQTSVDDEYALRQACRSVAEGMLHHQIEAFQEIAKIGGKWTDGRTRMYWVLRAFLSDQRSTHVDGVEFERLYGRASNLLAAEGRSESMPRKVVLTLLKKDLLASQQKFLKTPIIGYDATADRLVTMDSWTLFIIRLHRDKIVAALD